MQRSCALGAATLSLLALALVASPQAKADSLAAMSSSSMAETNNFSQPTLQNSNSAAANFSTSANRENGTGASFMAVGPLNVNYEMANRASQVFIPPKPVAWGQAGWIYPGAPDGMSNGWGTLTGAYAIPGTGPGPSPSTFKQHTPHLQIMEPHNFQVAAKYTIINKRREFYASRPMIWKGDHLM